MQQQQQQLMKSTFSASSHCNIDALGSFGGGGKGGEANVPKAALLSYKERGDANSCFDAYGERREEEEVAASS